MKLNFYIHLSIKKTGAYACLEFTDPTTGSVQYTSDKFYRKDAIKLYESSEQFKQAFDYVMGIAVDYRIKQGLFQLKNSLGEIGNLSLTPELPLEENITEEFEEDQIETQVEPQEVGYQSVF